MKIFNKIFFSIIIYLIILLGTLSAGGVIYSLKENVNPSCYERTEFKSKIQLGNYYINFPEVAYKKDKIYYIKNLKPEILVIIVLFLVLFYSVVWLLYVHKSIKNTEEEKFLLKTTNLEALATQNSMTILTENIHHELNSPLKVIERNYNKLKNLSLSIISEKYMNECVTDLEKIKEYFKINKINEIKYCNKSIRKKQFFDTYELFETSIDQIKTILQNMASFKQLRYSNGNKTIYDLVEGAAKILNVTIDTPFELEIDEKLKMYRADHKTGLKNADLINIFINHFKNSVEANATKIQVFEENLKGHYLLLNIKDNGNGIPKEFVSDIFTPNKSTKNDFVGLRGNGLFLNQNLLKQFGGDIKLKKTEEGKGTEFVLKIPIEKIKQAQ